MRTIKLVLMLCVGLSSSLTIYAQNVSELYQKEVGGNALLYHGMLETGYPVGHYVNTPYAQSEYVQGKLIYREMEYVHIPLRLDCRTRHVIMLSPDKKYNIQLNPAEIPFVTIGEQDYVWRTKDEGAPEDTYYCVLFEGGNWAIYKHYYVSNVNKVYVDGVSKQKFSLKERVYLKKGGKWIVITGRNDFIKQFRQYKTELQEYCKRENLRPGDKREEDWRKLAQYCFTLTK